MAEWPSDSVTLEGSEIANKVQDDDEEHSNSLLCPQRISWYEPYKHSPFSPIDRLGPSGFFASSKSSVHSPISDCPINLSVFWIIVDHGNFGSM